jgi:hypothetical protein
MAILMPFGKFRNRPLDEIPTDYLWWLLDEVDLRPRLKKAIQSEVDRRERPDPPPSPAAGPDLQKLKNLIQSWHRRTVMKHHPDRGGNLEVMKAFNAAFDDLKALLESL